MPHSHFLGASNSKLIVGGGPLFVVLGVPTPSKAAWGLREDSWDDCETADDVAIGCVPDEHLSIEGVSATQKKTIILTEGQKRYFVIMFRKSKHGSLVLVIPNHNVGIFTTLTTS